MEPQWAAWGRFSHVTDVTGGICTNVGTDRSCQDKCQPGRPCWVSAWGRDFILPVCIGLASCHLGSGTVGALGKVWFPDRTGFPDLLVTFSSKGRPADRSCRKNNSPFPKNFIQQFPHFISFYTHYERLQSLWVRLIWRSVFLCKADGDLCLGLHRRVRQLWWMYVAFAFVCAIMHDFLWTAFTPKECFSCCIWTSFDMHCFLLREPSNMLSWYKTQTRSVSFFHTVIYSH